MLISLYFYPTSALPYFIISLKVQIDKNGNICPSLVKVIGLDN